MHFLIVFSLLQGELAQTFLRVLTQFNEQLMNGSRIRAKKTVICMSYGEKRGSLHTPAHKSCDYRFLHYIAKVPRKAQ